MIGRVTQFCLPSMPENRNAPHYAVPLRAFEPPRHTGHEHLSLTNRESPDSYRGGANPQTTWTVPIRQRDRLGLALFAIVRTPAEDRLGRPSSAVRSQSTARFEIRIRPPHGQLASLELFGSGSASACRTVASAAVVNFGSLQTRSSARLYLGSGTFATSCRRRSDAFLPPIPPILGVAIFSYILAALFAEHRLAEENQKILTNELQHRTNNLLTVVKITVNHSTQAMIRKRKKRCSTREYGRWLGPISS